jgi:hypothetical protein
LTKYLTKGDIVLIIIFSFISLFGFVGIKNLFHTGRHLVVQVEGRRILELSLNIDSVQKVKGPLGETTIMVKDNKAWIYNSPCPDHLCMKMGKISRKGEIVVCVPNRVILTITGSGESNSLDGVTQ